MELFSVLFYLTAVVLIGFGVVAAAYESGFGSVFILVVALSVGHFVVEGVNILVWFTNNVGLFFSYFGIYLVVGLLWSFYKWYRYVKEYAAEFKGSYKKSAKDHKDRITSWMVLWPLSMTWAILSDPFHYLRRKFNKVFDKLTKAALLKAKIRPE